MQYIILCFIFFIIILLIINFILLKKIINILRKKYKEKNNKLQFASLKDPYINPQINKKIINVKKCNEIIEYSRDKLIQSKVVGGKHLDIRNSMQCWIPKNNPIVKPIFEKICNKYNIPFENAEALQVVRYTNGQFYNEHHDSCCKNNDKCKNFVKNSGQRILTVLIYLNDNFKGGHTYFKNLNLKLKTKPGDAIVFHPLAKNSNKCHPLALHAGLPIDSGEKWIANIWFREKNFKN